jgi:hypothetical protein
MNVNMLGGQALLLPFASFSFLSFISPEGILETPLDFSSVPCYLRLRFKIAVFFALGLKLERHCKIFGMPEQGWQVTIMTPTYSIDPGLSFEQKLDPYTTSGQSWISSLPEITHLLERTLGRGHVD